MVRLSHKKTFLYIWQFAVFPKESDFDYGDGCPAGVPWNIGDFCSLKKSVKLHTRVLEDAGK